MATKIITVEATPPAESTGADYYKGAPLNAAEFDQNLVNLRAAVDRKASLNNPTFTGTVTLPSTTSIGDVSATELQYLNSVTSNVQDQINSKAPINNPTFTGTVSLPGGTANGVLYLNGSKVATSGSALTFDGTNLGIGTASPAAKLHLNNGNVRLDSDSGTTTITVIKNGVGLGSLTTFGDTVATDFYTATVFKSSGVEKMRLDSSGNLGIGTASPAQKLVVTSAASGDIMQLLTAAGGGQGWKFGIDTTNSLMYCKSNTSNYKYQWQDGAGTGLMTLDSSGNLCLNTPGATTSVDGVAQKLNILVGDKSGMYFTHELSTPEQYVVIGSQFSSTNNGYTTQIRLGCENLNGIKSFIAFATHNNSGVAERMRLDSSGRLLVGTSSSIANNYRFQVANGSGGGYFECVATGDSAVLAKNTSGAGYIYAGVNSSGTLNYYVLPNGDVKNINNSYGAISDQKLKENIVDASPKLDDLCKVKVRNFNLIDDENKLKQIGVIAQELEEVFPSMVDETPDYEEVTKTRTIDIPAVLDEEGNEVEPATTKEEEYTERVATGTTTKSVKYSVFVPMLIKAVQEQQAIIESQAQTIESLTQRIEALEYTKQGE